MRKRLYRFHHDPDDSDAVIDAKVVQIRQHLRAYGAATDVVAPSPLVEFEVSPEARSTSALFP